MAAGAFLVFGPATLSIAKGTLDLDSGAFRMVLVTSSWTPNQSTNATWTTLSANEVANGGGYTTHGKLLTMSVTASGLVTTVDCDDQSWTSSTITAKYAVIVLDADANNALASTDQLLCYSDLSSGGGSVSTTSGAFSITINASGLFTITNS